jgi:hypothetical protein
MISSLEPGRAGQACGPPRRNWLRAGACCCPGSPCYSSRPASPPP